ncbi:Na(+)-translocating NADH-quinone reductase subunit C [Marinobacter shengliensis]|uniref:Na(+)-translocating NADH-quinone reductase subunit C n=1 Tax=Marinobacter shengliensis TaxID=1389223 RepID=UPI000D0EF647|nr:Na(+)-translocating NADH-quinone reductase subunit C [Marinobacter shengliensis]PSF10972.1 Na(+)-translocating NADH-quinone reductase subunit C [Marinobacter shengliensis]
MAKKKETVGKTIQVAFALCIVCSVIVSAAAVSLRPQQALNQELDIKSNILQAAGMAESGANRARIEELFGQFEPRLVDLRTGRFTTPEELGVPDVLSYNQYRAAGDPNMSTRLSGEQDTANLRRRAHAATVYILEEDGELVRVVLPVHGPGLWSTLYGFISLEGDLNTIEGLGFYDHAETPGLGGEVDNPRWKSQWVGQKIYGDDKSEPQIRLIKGGANPDSEHQIDSLSGATLTARGVENLINFWMGENGFAPFLKNLRDGEA